MLVSLLQVAGLNTPVVNDASLTLAVGECVCISGPSGAGKSLLLRAIADLDPHQGSVQLDGRSAESFAPCDWRRQVGLLPAESQWWGEHIGEHFSSVDEKALEALGFTRQVMEWQVARCSTGERQRLALLRLLQNRPQVLLLDEPTASLDAENVSRVEAVIARLRQEQELAVLWVSHDAAQAGRVATRRLHMLGGQIQEVA